MLNSLGLNKAPKDTKVAIAMSGGVDSSAVAYMLKEEGYDVFGITMSLLPSKEKQNNQNISENIKDAAVVAKQLGIEHHNLDFTKEFREAIIEYFAKTYFSGKTPSPCILCNRDVKFGIMAKKAVELGADLIVTGHYANMEIEGDNIKLYRGEDVRRDQSYFLFSANKKYLKLARFPLAGYTKDQTRAVATKAGLDVATKSDSQDICFVPDGKYAEIIQDVMPEKQVVPGDIVHVDGEVLGKHKGLIYYTIGQRRGLGIGGREVLYVIKLDAKTNQVIVGSQEDLKQRKVLINQINWLGDGDTPPKELYCEVKLRSRQAPVKAKVEFGDDDTAEVTILEEFYGVAPGQGCCFYLENRVLGGGFIVE